MNHTDEIKQLLYDYERAGLIDGDPVKVLSFLSDDIIGIGIGEQGFVSSKAEVAKLMMTTIKKDTEASYTLDYQNILIQFVDEHTANLCAKIIVRRTVGCETTTSGFMQSLNLLYENGRWIICQLHASSTMICAESIEAYPLAFADKTLANLRAELQQDTFELMNQKFSGGILGIYVREHFPLYFANDTMVSMLGYEHNEFMEKFKNNTNKLSYPDEKKHKDKLSALARKTDFHSRSRIIKKDGSLIWVEMQGRKTKDACGNDVLITIVTDVSDVVNLQMKTEKQHKDILSSIQYASKIQRNLLPTNEPFAEVFSDYSVLWKPRDIVGGDIYWMKGFSEGAVLALCDCTGHGTPGALLTMLVSSTLDNIVNERNYKDTAELMTQLDRRVATALNVQSTEESDSLTHIHDGCDLAILYIANDNTITLSSARIHVFICDGSEIKQIKGQRLHIGTGLLTTKHEVTVTEIPANVKNKFYVASDGLYDQIGGVDSTPFGYKRFKEIILQNHDEKQAVIQEKIWNAFEQYRGDHLRRDDVALITFKL